MPSGRALAVGAAVVVAIPAAFVAFKVVRSGHSAASKEDDEAAEVFSSATVRIDSAAPRSVSATAKKDVAAPAVPAPAAATKAKAAPSAPAAAATGHVDSLLDEALSELTPKTSTATTTTTSREVPEVRPTSAAAPAAALTVPTPSMSVSDAGRTEFAHLGISFVCPSAWEVREEPSPVPNVALITVTNPELMENPMAAQMPGAVPVVILSIEDVRGENLNLLEFKDRSKEASMQQMSMMTGGAITPSVRRDESCKEGPYEHLLEYSQSMPPFFDISVLNLLQVKDGIAYLFQLMCAPKVMNQYKTLFFDIARSTQLQSVGSSGIGHLTVYTGKVSVDIDAAWNWHYASPAGTALATMELPSTLKKEEITLYESGSVPVDAAFTEKSSTEVDGVAVKTLATASGQQQKQFTHGGFTMVARPVQKPTSTVSEQAVAAAVKSVQVCKTAPRAKEGATFVSPEFGYAFDVVQGSRVVASKLGNGTVVYAPCGIPKDMATMTPETQGPTVTIRIGSPANDPECEDTLEGWHARMQQEAAGSEISNIKLSTMKGERCLSFTSKEMQEVGQGQSIEVRGDVIIFVREGITTLIRWEAVTGQWRKYERDMTTFVESFHFLGGAAADDRDEL